jgi:hypothetical protein
MPGYRKFFSTTLFVRKIISKKEKNTHSFFPASFGTLGSKPAYPMYVHLLRACPSIRGLARGYAPSTPIKAKGTRWQKAAAQKQLDLSCAALPKIWRLGGVRLKSTGCHSLRTSGPA